MKYDNSPNGHENGQQGYFVPESHIAFSGTKYAAGAIFFPTTVGIFDILFSVLAAQVRCG